MIKNTRTVTQTTSTAGTFEASAEYFYQLGLYPFPVNDKVPAIKGWQKRRGLETTVSLASKFPDANIGIPTGHNTGITVLDLDDASQLEAAIKRFGDTPLIFGTPSGGYHLVYRHNGERCPNIRVQLGIDADLKGQGGFIVGPGSVRQDGQHAGKKYEVYCGSLTDFDPNSLPTIKPEALNVSDLPPANCGSVVQLDPRARGRIAGTGYRQTDIFDHCRYQAPGCQSEEDLVAAAVLRNSQFEVPLSDQEVRRTAVHVWRDYHLTGRNYVGSKGCAQLPYELIMRLAAETHGPIALHLYAFLKTRHGARTVPFAVCATEMTGKSLPWPVKKIDKARRLLCEIGALVCVRQGGLAEGGKTVPSLYRFPDRLPNWEII